jgi:hypothetical protein
MLLYGFLTTHGLLKVDKKETKEMSNRKVRVKKKVWKRHTIPI